MSSIRQKIIDNGRIPLMSEEGIIALTKWTLENKVNPSRLIRLSHSRPPIEREKLKGDNIDTLNSRCEILFAFLKKYKAEPDINKVRNHLAKVYPQVSEMSDDDILRMINIPENVVREAITSGNLSVLPKPLLALYEKYTDLFTHYEGINTKDFPYDCPVGGKRKFRIYFNLPLDSDGFKFWERVIVKCIERGIPFNCKPKENSGAQQDRGVFYVSNENLDSVVEILEEVESEHPKIIAKFGTPITSGFNYSYFSLVSTNPGRQTYNMEVNIHSRRALHCSIAKTILSDEDFCKSLTPSQLALVQRVANEQSYVDSILSDSMGPLSFLGGGGSHDDTAYKAIEQKYKETHNLYTPEFYETYRESFCAMMSVESYGDLEHKDMPIALSKEFYEGMEMSPPKRTSSEIPPKPKATEKPKVADVQAKPKKNFASMSEKEQSKVVNEKVDDAAMVIIDEFLVNCDANPAQAVTTMLSKLRELKAQYMAVAEANGLVGTPKYEYMMHKFELFEQFSKYTIVPGKSMLDNKEAEKKHYAALKGKARTIRMMLANFDKAEDKELAETAEVESKSNEIEARQQLVENIVDIMLEIFKEFDENFMEDPAKATEVFLTKIAQLKKEYMVASALVKDAKTTSQHQLVMKAFERFNDNPVYAGDPSGKQQYYENMAWDVRRDAQVVANKLDMFDVKD